MGRRRKDRSGALAALTGLVAAAAVIGGGLFWALRRSPNPPPQACQVAGPGTAVYTLNLDQAANASTIAGVGKRLGLPDHAITVALAAALQESKLRNLPYGDRDSVGIFQQRPSQGWGSREQLLKPAYAAQAFYSRLEKVPGWQDMAVTDAAQAVQHSAAPEAYGAWEGEARAYAIALTGEIAAGMSCRFNLQHPAVSALPAGALPFAEAVAAELGAPGTGVAVDPGRGWTIAAWAVGHAAEYHLRSVAFAGEQWSAVTGTWVADPSAGSAVEVS